MARQRVVQVNCDRCKKLEFLPAESAPAEDAPPILDASFEGERLLYKDLCEGCREAVSNLFQELKEWQRERKYTVISHNRPLPNGQAAPMQVAPNYSPPQPHSAAAAKR